MKEILKIEQLCFTDILINNLQWLAGIKEKDLQYQLYKMISSMDEVELMMATVHFARCLLLKQSKNKAFQSQVNLINSLGIVMITEGD